MVKDAPNNIPMNIIGKAQTSREILKDGGILIFPVVLITQTRMVDISVPNSVSRYPPSLWILIQYV